MADSKEIPQQSAGRGGDPATVREHAHNDRPYFSNGYDARIEKNFGIRCIVFESRLGPRMIHPWRGSSFQRGEKHDQTYGRNELGGVR